MSLQVWLPLNGDLRNQGLSTLSFNNISDTNTIIDSNGKIGKCYSNDSHTAGGLISDGTLELGQQQSMFCWFKFTDLNSSASLGGGLVSQHRSSAKAGMGITIRYVSSTTGYLSVNTGDGNSRTYNTYYGTTLLQANTWYHGGYTYDGSTIKIYVNGICEKTQAFSGMLVPAEYISCFCWNLTGSSGNIIQENYKFQGSLNDVRVYNHCLSENEIKKLAQGLTVHYPLNNNGLGGDNLLPDSNAPSLTNVAADYNRYIESSTSGTYTVTFEEITNPPIGSIKYGVRQNVTAVSGFHSLVWYSGGLIPLVVGETYTLSCYVKQISTGDNLKLKFQYGVTSTYKNSNVVLINDGKWHQYSWTFTVEETFAPNDAARIYCGGLASVGEVLICGYKLEKGPVATPWCLNVIDEDYIAINMEYDISGNGYNAIQNSAFTHSSDTPKYTVSTVFDGTVDATVPTIYDSDDRFQQLTIAAWIKRTSDDDEYRYYWRSQGMSAGLRPYNELNSLYYFQWRHATIDTVVSMHGWVTSVIPLNTWVHNVWVFDSGFLKQYINGELIRTRNDSNTGTYICGDIGGTVGEAWQGGISDIRIYATALSDEEVKSLYQNCATIGPDGTIYGQIHS